MVLWYNIPCRTTLSSGKIQKLLLCRISFNFLYMKYSVHAELIYLIYVKMMAYDAFLQSETPAQNISMCILAVAYL